VLDDFSKPKAQPTQPAPAPAPTDSATGVTAPGFDEDAFLKQLEKDMANMMGTPAGPGAAELPDFQNAVDQGAGVFAKQLEESGIPPGDFLKQLLADVMAEEGGAGAGSAAGSSTKPSSAAAPNPPAGDGQPAESFNDAIQRTMERMKESGNKATEAASTDDGSDDMLAQLLKAVEAGAAGAGEDGDLTKMFMGMMEQLSNKEMLYEPMKELNGKFGPWIEKNKAEDKVPAEDMSRYETQAKIVKQIVQKFEEPGYTDEDPKCREYIWERMQEVRRSWIVFVFGGSRANIVYRCKLQAARRKNWFRTRSWRIWEVWEAWEPRQVQEGLEESPTVRSNKDWNHFDHFDTHPMFVGLLCTVHIHNHVDSLIYSEASMIRTRNAT